MRRAFGVLLMAGLFLLLLSALVVTPETAPAVSAASLPEELQAVFMPALPPATTDSPNALSRPMELRILFSAALIMTALVLPRPALRDANGRIITAVRYENSVYQLFRPEVAGG